MYRPFKPVHRGSSILDILKSGDEFKYRFRDLKKIFKTGLRDYIQVWEVLSHDKFIEIKYSAAEMYVYPKVEFGNMFTFFYYIDNKGQLFSIWGKKGYSSTERCKDKTKLKPCFAHFKLWIDTNTTKIGDFKELEGDLYNVVGIEEFKGREVFHLVNNFGGLPGFDNSIGVIHNYYCKKTGILVKEGNELWQNELIGGTLSF